MSVVTVREAAARLGVSYSTLKQWIYKGRIDSVRTDGGHHRIPMAEVDRLLTRPGPGPAPGRMLAPTAGLAALSGRNRLTGVVEEVRQDGLLAQVRLKVGDQSLTAVITCDAADELRLRRGDMAVAIIKATEVMVGRLADPGAVTAR